MSEPSSSSKRNPLRALAALVPALLGAGIALLAVPVLERWIPDAELLPWQDAVVVLGIVLTLLLVLALHEAGHLLGGRLAGFRMLLYVVGPLRIEQAGERLRLGLNRSLAMWGGVAASVPQDTRDLRRRMLLVVAGGPVTSLLGGAAVLALANALGLREASTTSLAEVLGTMAVIIFGAVSVLIGVVTLIPGKSSGFYTDGARFLRLLRPGPETDREVAVLALTGLSMGGRRPREWDPALVAQALVPAEASLYEPAARLLAHAHALDSGRIDEARAHLEAALARRDLLPEAARPGLFLQAAYFAGVHDGDGRRARELLDQARGGLLVPAHQRLLAEAAVLWREGDSAGALERLDRARALAGQGTDAGSARAELDWIEDLRRAIGG